MSTAMYDAREALIPGSAYDRSNAGIYLLVILSTGFCLQSKDFTPHLLQVMLTFHFPY